MSGEERTTHWTTQLLGLGLIAASYATVLFVSLILLDGGDFLGFTIGITTVAVIVTILVWQFDRLWSRIVGVVATLLMALTSFWLAFGVFTPFSPLEFVVGLAFLMGIVLSLLGGIRAIVAGRRGRVGPTAVEGKLRSAVVGILAVAAVVSVVGLMATRSTVSETEASGATVLNMVKYEFDPDPTVVPAGDSLLVTNSDLFSHDFTLDELGISVHFGPTDEALIDLSGAAPGTYDYICSLHSDGTIGMMGTITIES